MTNLKPSYRSEWLSLLWLLAVPTLNVFYGVLNRAGDRVFSLQTNLDVLIPFVPGFIVPYLIWYPFITGVLIALAFRNRMVYFQTLIALCSGLIISYIFFALFQTSIQRPDMQYETGFLARLVQFVYSTDQPYNCFPSIHVLTSYLMLRGAYVFSRPIRLSVAIISILIIISTVFVKQHVVADILGGILVGELCLRLAKVVVIRKKVILLNLE
ncbi:phosphatase PAP2 family protein [Paenibacillus polysaccharolyticus]|uniref:phosphatase PAP2 family protein n=1 Tax=Paenibacillus polysaccharolyticus TaxID=582692 RepID=UPI0020A2193A|nr:phosphatase PAP2 family protein [Paenibacillus polysaccharolyticus]MCP1133708.1 phosphatase PAP2 family protein [Paenibacillus polysaccharolyticus]